ncbi:MAG: hypothetical protein QMC85_07580 [Methanocellales archaeon]|nr:hypothetical protein [Methanocellales archaeon]
MSGKPFEVTYEDATYWIREEEDRIYKVFSMDSNKIHMVNMGEGLCDCEDFIYRRQLQGDRTCKHIDMIRTNVQKELDAFKSELEAARQPQRETKKEGLVLEVPEEYREYIVMERKDEDQILAEIKGEILKEYVYSFPSGGRQVTGLSYAGVKEVARRLGSITLSDLKIDEREDSYTVQVKATDKIRDFQMWGVAKQPKKMKLRDGTEVEDQFALQKAVSKSQRNALRAIIPEKIAIEMLKTLLEGVGHLNSSSRR